MRALLLSLVVGLSSLGLATVTPTPARAAVPPAVYSSSFEPVAYHGWRGWRGGSHYRGYWGGYYRPYWGGYYRPYWGGYSPWYGAYYGGYYPGYSTYYGYPSGVYYGSYYGPGFSIWW